MSSNSRTTTTDSWCTDNQSTNSFTSRVGKMNIFNNWIDNCPFLPTNPDFARMIFARMRWALLGTISKLFSIVDNAHPTVCDRSSNYLPYQKLIQIIIQQVSQQPFVLILCKAKSTFFVFTFSQDKEVKLGL